MIADYFLPIEERCTGCSRIITQPALIPGEDEKKTCAACLNPALKWKNGKCNLATHIKIEEKAKVFVDPIKASKQMMKGKK